jgi:hypothetical protein
MAEYQLSAVDAQEEPPASAAGNATSADTATGGGDGNDTGLETRIEAGVKERTESIRKAAEEAAERKWQGIARRDNAVYQSEAARLKAQLAQLEAERTQVVDKAKELLSPAEALEMERLALDQDKARIKADEDARTAVTTQAQQRAAYQAQVNGEHARRLEQLSRLGVIEGVSPTDPNHFDKLPKEVQAMFEASWGDDVTLAASNTIFNEKLTGFLAKRNQKEPAAEEDDPPTARRRIDPVAAQGVGRGGTPPSDIYTTSADDIFAMAARNKTAKARQGVRSG